MDKSTAAERLQSGGTPARRRINSPLLQVGSTLRLSYDEGKRVYQCSGKL